MSIISPEREFIPEHKIEGPKIYYFAHTDIVHPEVKWWVKGSIMSGVLDDIVPASMLLSLAVDQELKGIPIFTYDEESGMEVALKEMKKIEKAHTPPKGVHKYWGDRTWNPTMCIIEVTDINGDVDVSFENFVFFDANRIRKIMDRPHLADIDYKIHGAGGWDETFRAADLKLPAFSVSLPVVGNFHTYDAWVSLEKVSKLKRVIREIDKELG